MQSGSFSESDSDDDILLAASYSDKNKESVLTSDDIDDNHILNETMDRSLFPNGNQ